MSESQTVEILEEDIEFDPRTGEILDMGKPAATGEPAEQLSQIARWLDGRHEALLHLDKPQDKCFCKSCMLGREHESIVDRLSVMTRLKDERIVKMKERIAFLTEWGKQIMDDSGQEKVAIPGVGKFAYRKGVESVDTTDYDELDDLDKQAIQSDEPGLFTTKTTVNKKNIKEAFKVGEDVSKYGFGMTRPDPTFGFTREK